MKNLFIIKGACLIFLLGFAGGAANSTALNNKNDINLLNGNADIKFKENEELSDSSIQVEIIIPTIDSEINSHSTLSLNDNNSMFPTPAPEKGVTDNASNQDAIDKIGIDINSFASSTEEITELKEKGIYDLDTPSGIKKFSDSSEIENHSLPSISGDYNTTQPTRLETAVVSDNASNLTTLAHDNKSTLTSEASSDVTVNNEELAAEAHNQPFFPENSAFAILLVCLGLLGLTARQRNDGF